MLTGGLFIKFYRRDVCTAVNAPLLTKRECEGRVILFRLALRW